MKFFPLILVCLFFYSCNTTDMQSKVSALENELAAAKKQYTPGLIHSVFFWLKEDLSAADEAAFLAGTKSLTAVSTVKKCYIGPPAATEERGVVDNSFSYALIVHFDDLEGQNAYQVDPIHLKFVEDHKDKWTKVIVYDNVLK